MIQDFHFWVCATKVVSQGPYGNMDKDVHCWCFALLGIDGDLGVHYRESA